MGNISLGELLSSMAFPFRRVARCIHGIQHCCVFCFKVGVCLHLVPKQSLLRGHFLRKPLVFWKGSRAMTAVHHVEKQSFPPPEVSLILMW